MECGFGRRPVLSYHYTMFNTEHTHHWLSEAINAKLDNLILFEYLKLLFIN